MVVQRTITMCKSAITAMEVTREEYSLDEWLAVLQKREADAILRGKEEEKGFSNMAKTNVGLPDRSNGEAFKTVISKDQASLWLCFNYNGRPGSCKWEGNCKFKHEKDRSIRDAWLLKVKAKNAERRADRNAEALRKTSNNKRNDAPVHAKVASAVDAASDQDAKDTANLLKHLAKISSDAIEKWHQTNSKQLSDEEAEEGINRTNEKEERTKNETEDEVEVEKEVRNDKESKEKKEDEKKTKYKVKFIWRKKEENKGEKKEEKKGKNEEERKEKKQGKK